MLKNCYAIAKFYSYIDPQAVYGTATYLGTWRKDGSRVKRGKSPHRGTGDSTQVEVPKGTALEQTRHVLS